MDNSHIDISQTKKTKTVLHVMNYIMGVMLTVFIVVMVAFFLFSCNNENEGYASRQRENVIVTIGNVTDLGVRTIQ